MSNEKEFLLWEDKVPGYIGGEIPKITYYPSKNKKGDGAVVIFPGGGYAMRADHEGKGYAKYLCNNGIDCFVVDYRVSPNRFPYPLLDARRAVRFVRANAGKFGVNKNKIAVMGSSAGGHLAALLSTYKLPVEGESADNIDSNDFMPNLQILCYPVIDIEGHRGSFVNLLGDNADELADTVTPYLLCDKNTPPVFLWHTSCDPAVNVINSYRYAIALRKLSVQVEMHIYPEGGHGLGLAESTPFISGWSARLCEFLRHYGYISE